MSTICTNPFRLPKNGLKGVKLVSKMDGKKWNMDFCLEDSIRKNRTTFSDVPLLPEIFCWNDPKSRVTYIVQPDFPETFCKMINSVYVFFFQHKLTSDSGFLKMSNNDKNQIPLLVPIALNLFFLAYDTDK